MIRVRVKRVNNKQQHDFFTTKINLSFLQAKNYYLNANRYWVDLCFLTMQETVWENISIELLDV